MSVDKSGRYSRAVELGLTLFKSFKATRGITRLRLTLPFVFRLRFDLGPTYIATSSGSFTCALCTLMTLCRAEDCSELLDSESSSSNFSTTSVSVTSASGRWTPLVESIRLLLEQKSRFSSEVNISEDCLLCSGCDVLILETRSGCGLSS